MGRHHAQSKTTEEDFLIQSVVSEMKEKKTHLCEIKGYFRTKPARELFFQVHIDRMRIVSTNIDQSENAEIANFGIIQLNESSKLLSFRRSMGRELYTRKNQYFEFLRMIFFFQLKEAHHLT